MEYEGTPTQELWDRLEVLIQDCIKINESSERSRNLSLVVTNLENAQDKLRRHIVGGA